MIFHVERLNQVHPSLVNFFYLLYDALYPRHKDWLIICGWRNQADQHAAFLAGNSKVDWPDSKHNHMADIAGKIYPDSYAIDISPYPYDQGKDERRLYLIAGYSMRLADEQGLAIRFGADWDGDLATSDQRLHDPWHMELA